VMLSKDGPMTDGTVPGGGAASAQVRLLGRYALGVELVWALEPTLRDCRHTGIDVERARRYIADQVQAVPTMSTVDNIVHITGMVQQHLAGSDGAGRPDEAAVGWWPPCPRHPHHHPLRPQVIQDIACWVCPETGAVASAIGSL
jgi:hypothetical protein